MLTIVIHFRIRLMVIIDVNGCRKFSSTQQFPHAEHLICSNCSTAETHLFFLSLMFPCGVRRQKRFDNVFIASCFYRVCLRFKQNYGSKS